MSNFNSSNRGLIANSNGWTVQNQDVISHLRPPLSVIHFKRGVNARDRGQLFSDHEGNQNIYWQ